MRSPLSPKHRHRRNRHFAATDRQYCLRGFERLWIGAAKVSTAITDSKGRYVFQKVAQGARRVDLDIERLPAHYNPAGSIHQFVDVRPTETSRADFHIVSLAWCEGRVRDSEQLRLENVVVRLRPGDRYTTAESDGSFSFHNLPLGEYEVSIDPSELPGEVVILSKRTVPVSLFDGSEAPFVSFQLGVRRKKKRIRHIEIPGGWSVFGVQRLRRLVAAPGLAARPHLDAAKTMTGDAS